MSRYVFQLQHTQRHDVHVIQAFLGPDSSTALADSMRTLGYDHESEECVISESGALSLRLPVDRTSIRNLTNSKGLVTLAVSLLTWHGTHGKAEVTDPASLVTAEVLDDLDFMKRCPPNHKLRAILGKDFHEPQSRTLWSFTFPKGGAVAQTLKPNHCRDYP